MPAIRQDTVERFRQRLLEIIRTSGLSRSAFARKVGMDRSTLSQILSPSTQRLPRVETLTAIAASEHVSIDWLVGLSEEGGLKTDLMHQKMEFHPGGRAPSDRRLAQWHAEAIGYKVRYVPTTIPDLLKSGSVIEHEFKASAAATPEQRHETSRELLDYQRRPGTDQEVCSPVQDLEALARGYGLWSGLPPRVRRAQLRRMIDLTDELYPTLRWFLYDGLKRFSVPLTIFGPKRAAIYLGQMYLVVNSRNYIEVLTRHFDDLIRAAVVQPPDVSALLRQLHDAIE